MDESILTKLKKVTWNDIVHIFKFIITFPIALVYKRFRRNIWLLCEYGEEARDNAYYLFKYLCENHPEIDAVYAINQKGRDYAKIKALGASVEFGSLRHWLYYLAARVNVSSQKGGKPNAAVCYALEVSGMLKNIRVFLQHGVTKDDLPFLYYKNTKIRLFACAALPEYCFIRDTFGYPKGFVKYLGFCRFDALYNLRVDSELVLIVPTWRNYLYTQQMKQREDFTKTDYYKYWMALLGHPLFEKIILQYRKRVVFCVHRNMEPYSDLFHSPSSSIEILKWSNADITKLIHNASMIITDYSSIYMDFAYMRRPIIYYQFDYESYRKGHLPAGYFDYERDGFGPICREADSVVREFQRIAQGGVMDSLYLERQKKFFPLHDNHNCERTYQAINEVCNEGR